MEIYGLVELNGVKSNFVMRLDIFVRSLTPDQLLRRTLEKMNQHLKSSDDEDEYEDDVDGQSEWE